MQLKKKIILVISLILSMILLISCTKPNNNILDESSIFSAISVSDIAKNAKPSNTAKKPNKKVNLKINIKVADKTFTATLKNNNTAKEFLKRLPMTLEMNDLNKNEKYFYLTDELYSNPKRIDNIKNGDIMLYGTDCLVLFYESFTSSYSYTQLGKVDDITGFSKALGKDLITVTLSAYK